MVGQHIKLAIAPLQMILNLVTISTYSGLSLNLDLSIIPSLITRLSRSNIKYHLLMITNTK